MTRWSGGDDIVLAAEDDTARIGREGLEEDTVALDVDGREAVHVIRDGIGLDGKRVPGHIQPMIVDFPRLRTEADTSAGSGSRQPLPPPLQHGNDPVRTRLDWETGVVLVEYDIIQPMGV